MMIIIIITLIMIIKYFKLIVIRIIYSISVSNALGINTLMYTTAKP